MKRIIKKLLSILFILEALFVLGSFIEYSSFFNNSNKNTIIITLILILLPSLIWISIERFNFLFKYRNHVKYNYKKYFFFSLSYQIISIFFEKGSDISEIGTLSNILFAGNILVNFPLILGLDKYKYEITKSILIRFYLVALFFIFNCVVLAFEFNKGWQL